jgi:hypothetical protein
MPAQTVIQIRRDTAANWESTDPTLASGEIGFDTTNNQIKIGNGSDEWTVLDYASGGASVQISETAPTDPDAGNVWFNSTDGRAYIYYDSVWVDLNPGIAGPAGKFTVSETAPEDATSGDGWFNSATARLFIRYDNFWVEATSNYIGPAGPTGETGATGPSGVVAATSPITYNSETQTVAITQSAIAINMSQVATTVSDKSANYTLVSADENTYIRSTGSAITITVPDVLANGESVNFIQAGAGQITFAGSSVTINSVDAKLKTNKQFSGATITKLGGAYYLVGDLGA